MTYSIRRTDINQKQIVKELRQLGYSVCSLHTVGNGCPDLVIGKAGINLLVEVKRKGEHLTADEGRFFATWSGVVIIGYNAEQIHTAFVEINGEFQ